MGTGRCKGKVKARPAITPITLGEGAGRGQGSHALSSVGLCALSPFGNGCCAVLCPEGRPCIAVGS